MCWKYWQGALNLPYYSSGTWSVPPLISSISSRGGLPSTVHPTDWHVPSISLTVPLRYFAIDLGLIDRAMETISSNDRFPLCLIFFCLFRSLGGSFKALIIKEAADGTTVIVACRFCIVNWTVIFKPFQSLVALAISSPTFLGDYKYKPIFKHYINVFYSLIECKIESNNERGRLLFTIIK